MTLSRKCANPYCGRVSRANARCTACYQFQRRTGFDRPEELIVANGLRQMIRELEQVRGRFAS